MGLYPFLEHVILLPGCGHDGDEPSIVSVNIFQVCIGAESTQKGKYRYRRKGLLDQNPHRKLLRGVIIIRKSGLETVMKLLIEWDAVVDQRIIEPTEEDLKILGEVEK
ncbi:MAG: hypothetical protein M1460_00730 [Candidatus Thermoplasmatota archaeon]|jgi:hypothetical protein|nr:hypothetical protein [Candidatus Thermoplasmatota archaeon]